MTHNLRADIGIRVPDEVSDELLESFLPTLSPREERIVRRYYHDGQTEREIGKQEVSTVTGRTITGERVNQIRTKALRKLRHNSRLGRYVANPEYVAANPQLYPPIKP